VLAGNAQDPGGDSIELVAVENGAKLPITQVMSISPPSERLLIVDDEDQIRTLLARLLGAHGYECLTAESAAAARRVLKETDVAIVLSDVNMPGESGIDFTREVLAQYPDTAVVMVTGMDDRSYADAAIELGAYGYVLKPFKPNELIINVGNALRRRALEIENRSSRERLEQTVLDRTAALRDTIAQLESSDAELRRLREETIRRLSWAAEFRNQETGEHIVRMSLYCALLARLAGLDADHAEAIRIASPMHDVGKIGIPDRILLKPGRLTDDERRVMEAHTEMGHRILAGSGVELLDLAAVMALTHHEWIDGTGYPSGAAGDEIPIEGRICAIADVFDALTADRVYRPAFQPDEARSLMLEGRGTQFDPHLLDLFFGSFDDVLAIRRAAGTGTAEHTLAVALAHASGRRASV
jgi:putative two-component system response regulator